MKVISKALMNCTLEVRITAPFNDESVTKRFKTDCLKFLVDLCVQIRKRFNFDGNGVNV